MLLFLHGIRLGRGHDDARVSVCICSLTVVSSALRVGSKKRDTASPPHYLAGQQQGSCFRLFLQMCTAGQQCSSSCWCSVPERSRFPLAAWLSLAGFVPAQRSDNAADSLRRGWAEGCSRAGGVPEWELRLDSQPDFWDLKEREVLPFKYSRMHP